MLGGSDRKVVGTGEIFLGAHVEVIVLGIVQDAFQSLIGGDTDRTRRKTGMLISVIGGIHFQMLVKDASQFEFS